MLLLVLAGYGVAQVSGAARGHTLKAETITLIVVSLAVAAGVRGRSGPRPCGCGAKDRW